jgi:Transcriptional regulator
VLAYDKRLQHLLTVAARTYAERGYQATSMRDLSKASGFSLAGIYHYVTSKLELLYLIQDRCFSLVIIGAREAVAQAGGEGPRPGSPHSSSIT